MTATRNEQDEKLREKMRLTDAARLLYQAANPPRDPRILSQSSSAALEQRMKANDQAIAAVIAEELEQQEAEQKEEKQPADPFKEIETERCRALQKTVALSNDFAQTNQQSPLLNVPTELIQKIYSHSTLNEHAGLTKLDRKSCEMFQPSCRKARLQQLLQHVVYGNYDTVKKILDAANPALLLFLLQGTDKVTDYSGRDIEGTALRMALGAEDVNRAKLDKDNKPALDANGNIQIVHPNEGMAELLMGYFKKAFSNNEAKAQEEIEKQIRKQFPAGHEALDAQRKQADFAALEEVINAIAVADVQFINGNYDDSHGETKMDAKCEAALKKFRDYLKPKGVIKEGKHFNAQLLVDAIELYDKIFESFGATTKSPKNVLFCRKIVGFIQRYLPACVAQELCQPHWAASYKLNRSLKVRDGRGSFFPLDLVPLSRLGHDVALGNNPSYTGCPVGFDALFASTVYFKNLCQAKNSSLAKFMPYPDNPSKTRAVIL